MDVTKALPVDPSADRGGLPPLQQQATPPLPAPAALDRVEIQPLDLVGALLILIAEVRAGLPLPQAGSPFAGVTEPTLGQASALALGQAPDLAPQLLVRLFLQALPDEESATAPGSAQGSSAWPADLTQLETALAAALDKGVEAVTAWRDVSPAVVAGVEDARAVVLRVLGADTVNGAWLRPEWLGLAPRLERYWRRRRRGRRGLSNPDHERERRIDPADQGDPS